MGVPASSLSQLRGPWLENVEDPCFNSTVFVPDTKMCHVTGVYQSGKLPPDKYLYICAPVKVYLVNFLEMPGLTFLRIVLANQVYCIYLKYFSDLL